MGQNTSGGSALGDSLPPETQQRALAAVLRPIARISHHSWLDDLVLALDALRFGEVHPIVTPSPSRLHGYKQARTVWLARLRALGWVEFQYQAKLMTKESALWEVASAFKRRDVRSLKNWQKRAEELFGSDFVGEALSRAGAAGRRYRRIQDELSCGMLEKSAAARELDHLESCFGSARLQRIAQVYNAQKRKRRQGK
jgi:hypothetical protein